MMFWQESGRRIKAEDERDAAVAELKKVVKERNLVAAAVKEAVKEVVKGQEQMVAAAVKEVFRAVSAQAAQERATLEQQLAEQGQEIQTLRAQIAGLQEERRPRRRARRRPLRDTDDA